MSGINGGMIILTADDPSMHSSQNEQDNRVYGNFAMIPMFEPSSQQEAYDMVYHGFELSEKLGYPILLRVTTRMAHSRAGVVTSPLKPENRMNCPEDGRQRFILLPALARKRFKSLLASQEAFTEASENSAYNKYFDAPNKDLGIITTGIAFNYLSENYPDGFEHPVLKISQYPLPRKQVEKIVGECKEILVLEEGYPVVEEQLKGFLAKGVTVHGRLDGTLQRDGELTPDAVGKALGKEIQSYYAIPEVVEQRPPALCQGCGHRDMYEALNEVIAEYNGTAKVFGDIGCYTLGALPPFRAIDSCIDMGASITMAKGASDAGVFPAISVIGDSTFTHSGMTGLLDCVNENTNITIVISDNETTAMTGGQDSAGTGRLESICAGIGVDLHDHVLHTGDGAQGGFKGNAQRDGENTQLDLRDFHRDSFLPKILMGQFVHGRGNDLGVFHETADLDKFIGLVLPYLVAGEYGAESQSIGHHLGVSSSADALRLSGEPGAVLIDLQQLFH